jgi:hypothetical protein
LIHFGHHHPKGCAKRVQRKGARKSLATWVCHLCLDCASLLGGFILKVRSRSLTVQAGLAVQEGVFLDRATCQLALTVADADSMAVAIGVAVLSGRGGRGDVWDLLGVGVLATDLGDTNVASFAGLGEGVVAAVEILALLWILSVGNCVFGGLCTPSACSGASPSCWEACHRDGRVWPPALTFSEPPC